MAEQAADIEWALELLSSRFARVIWSPGNHDLWTVQRDALRLSGEDRYLHLVQRCRALGVVTPEDPYPVWEGRGGSWARVAATEARLEADDGDRMVLVNHQPLIREPTRILRHPEFAQWCGTELSANWRQRRILPAEV